MTLLRMWIVRKPCIGFGLADVIDFYPEDLTLWVKDYLCQYSGDFYTLHIRISPLAHTSEVF